MLAPLIAGRYRIVHLLGAGTTSMVYKTRSEETGQYCALRVIHPHLLGGKKEAVALFLQEALVTAIVGQHPHLVDIVDAGEDPIRVAPYIAMEFLEGQTLANHLTYHGKLSPQAAVTIFQQLADALTQAHQRHVIHQGLKPSHLFLTQGQAGEPWLKLTDLGIAKAFAHEALRPTVPRGTLAYSAPEQLEDLAVERAPRQEPPTDTGICPATDVWAFGLIAYEALTGHQSGQYWDVEDEGALPQRILERPREVPSRRAGARAEHLPKGFDDWFLRCLQSDAARRWPSFSEAAANLAALFPCSASKSASTGAPPPPARSTPARLAMPTSVSQPPATAPAPQPAPTPEPTAAPAAIQAPAPQAIRTVPAVSPPNAPAKAATQTTTRRALSSPKAAAGEAKGAETQKSPLPIVAIVGCALAVAVGLAEVITEWGPELQKRYATSRCAIEGYPIRATACEMACSRGVMSSCNTLGNLHRSGDGAARNPPLAVGYYEKACAGGNLEGCRNLVPMYHDGLGTAVGQQTAAKLYEKVCRDGMATGCGYLALMYQRGEGGFEKDERRARDLYQLACKGGEPLSCANLGLMHQRGRGGLEKDAGRARKLFEKACEGGGMLGCANLGAMYKGGNGGLAKDEVRARVLFQEACDGGEMVGCNALGVMHQDGRGGLGKDSARARELYEKACDGGEMRGCTNLGSAFKVWHGGREADLVHARELFQKACDRDEMRGCKNLGDLYQEGQGDLPKDEVQARRLYQKACDGDEMRGCNSLAVMLQYGRGGLPEDTERARELYLRTCNGGEMRSCNNLGVLYHHGRGGLRQDPERARELYQKACDARLTRGCDNLKTLATTSAGIAPERRARAVADAQVYLMLARD